MVVTTPLGAQDDTVETWDASRPRRSVRQFTEQPLPDEMLDRILKAGRCAPLGGQLTAARLRARHEQGRSCSDWRRPGKGAKHVAGAAAAIAVAAPEPQDDLHFLLQHDLGQATYAMTVAAADLGVGAGHAAAADQDQAGPFWASRRDVSGPTYFPSAIRRTSRWPTSSG